MICSYHLHKEPFKSMQLRHAASSNITCVNKFLPENCHKSARATSAPDRVSPDESI